MSRPEEQYADVGTCKSTGLPIRLCYHTFGDRRQPCILLIMTIACPAPLWDDAFCHALATAGPFFVVRYDSRDIALSTHLEAADPPEKRPGYMKIAHALLRRGTRVVSEVYTLGDMADDAAGLLQSLRVPAAHIVGMCMGGCIAQCLALQHPQRVLSLTLFATNAGGPESRWPGVRDVYALASLIPGSTTATYAPRLAAAASDDARRAILEEQRTEKVKTYARSLAGLVEKVYGDKKKFPVDHARCVRQMERVFQRSLRVEGAARQMRALINAPARGDALRRTIHSVRPAASNAVSSSSSSTNTTTGAAPYYMPTLIIQGTHDVLCPKANATQLAGIIQGSKLRMVDGLGHVLAPSMRASFVAWIKENVAEGERAKSLRPATMRPVAASKL